MLFKVVSSTIIYTFGDVQSSFSSDNDTDEFIIAFSGKRKTKEELEKANKNGDFATELVAGAVVSSILFNIV